ncbi:MAG TPA: TlpA disulfide reductase family protein [Bryobacteraceae bacterium]|jgi:thiol-disulfide isomerase/thioredoxin|nr:TlpA disulfide reductase family protein [Bryobacteraceae bacterium]
MRNLGLIALAFSPALFAQSIDGIWQATVDVKGLEVPFRIEFQNSASGIEGSLFNGDERFISTSGQFQNGSLMLAWDYMAAKLEAKLVGGELSGTFLRPNKVVYAFHATRGVKTSEPSPVPSIGGLWTLEGVHSDKGESAWQFIVRQNGASASAAILRIDGDTGTLTGSYKNGEFVLSHFSGMRPALVEVRPATDGTLKVILNHRQEMTAVRPEKATVKPDDPARHTGVKDASEPFHFRFPDLNGKMVSDADPRFKGKVVLVNITGSWCPNCHDEAPFLAETYRKYRAQGLEIVALSFEEADQLKDPVRLRAFIRRYGIEYTVLLAGDTDSAKEKLAQATNWDAWPTTFFLGRDGRVRAVHTGFPSKASGELYTKATEEFSAEVEKLLAENVLTLP